MQGKRTAYLLPFLVAFVWIFPARPASCQLHTAAGFYKQGAQEALGGNLERAVELFQKSIEKNRYYALAHYGLGKAYLYMGKIRESIKHLEKATGYDSKYAPAFFYLGLACLFGKKYNDAISAFSKSLKLDPSLVEAFYNIGVAYDETGRTMKASIFFEKYVYESKKQEMDILF